MLKMDAARIRAAAEKLYGPPPKIAVVVPTSKTAPQTWRYTTSQPVPDWFDPNFNDGAWKEGPGGFGAEGTPGAIVRTKWDTPDIWLRRTFDVQNKTRSGQLALDIHHDDDAQVYLNGKLIKSFKRYAKNYQLALLDAGAQRLLTPGKNTLAIHCSQKGGGQYIDAGLVEIVEQ
jgi:hypothetical protein